MTAIATKRLGVGLALAVSLITLTACGTGSGAATAPNSSGTAPAPSASPPMAAESGDDASPEPAKTDEQFGMACSAMPDDGEGSFTGMADEPVATAASKNPLLSTLVSAVKRAGLVDTLNTAENITVFAPTNDAFAKIDKAVLKRVLADKKTLTDLLTYHVVRGRKTREDLKRGSFTTLQGGKVATVYTDDGYLVGDATVVCGNVRTRNATVYLIDTVLVPTS
ncbi:fasciclin domain-containing protein [Nonomuraea rubra]|uniref:Putative surface protein with fasciclin (FAS1) repeats n=1 Tax=Nonomuraea rubra TaxID=46180 RepID=A0A7X0U2V5_9ACTN|nr:fasciclin domain-containing protein [Nonomuraea rubra]MBB6553232.1 putative surface protein with fasciclin (FAS1) repeats [Nonomuraea rubra]